MYHEDFHFLRYLSSCKHHFVFLPTQSTQFKDIITRADSSLVGYLGVYFLGDALNGYFYQSNSNNAILFKSLNGG